MVRGFLATKHRNKHFYFNGKEQMFQSVKENSLFANISNLEDFPKFSEVEKKLSKTFSKLFRKLWKVPTDIPKITENILIFPENSCFMSIHQKEHNTVGFLKFQFVQ